MRQYSWLLEQKLEIIEKLHITEHSVLTQLNRVQYKR